MKQNWAKSNKMGSNEQHGLQNLSLTSEHFRTLSKKTIFGNVFASFLFWLLIDFLWEDCSCEFPPPYLSHPNFLPPYRWHNRDWAQPSICPTLPFPFPHQTMPQECNFDKLKRKWVWGVLTKESSTNIIYIFKRKKSSGTVAVKFLQAVFSPLQKTESSQSLVSSNGAAYN